MILEQKKFWPPVLDLCSGFDSWFFFFKRPFFMPLSIKFKTTSLLARAYAESASINYLNIIEYSGSYERRSPINNVKNICVPSFHHQLFGWMINSFSMHNKYNHAELCYLKRSEIIWKLRAWSCHKNITYLVLANTS